MLMAPRNPRSVVPRSTDFQLLDTAIALADTVVRRHFTPSQRYVPQLFMKLPILHRHLLDTVPLEAMRRAGFSSAPVGNGPFRFVRRVPGQRWTFERNDA